MTSWSERWDGLRQKLASPEELSILVSDPSYRGGGSFTSNRYVVYLVTTRTHGWIVRRRYSDFVWLRDVLNARFVGLFLPSLPAKDAMSGATTKKSNDDLMKSDFIVTRLLLLRYFLEDLSRIPFIKSDASFQSFLSVQDDKEFAAAKEQTGNIDAAVDTNEGIAVWREAVTTFPCPLTWDRAVADFKSQLDVLDSNIKQIRKSIDSHIDALSSSAVTSGRLLQSIRNAAEQENDFGDTTKTEYINKDSERAVAINAAFVKALGEDNQCALTAPMNLDLIVRSGLKYLGNQVSAFRAYLKQAEDCAKDVLNETKKLDAYLDDKRNGKEVKKRGAFMTGMGKKLSAEEIIEEQQLILQKKSTTRDMVISAIEFSELDRFHYERTQFMSQIIALVAAAEQEVAKHRQQAWSECLLSTGLCGTESLGKAVAISPLMGALSASTMINSMAKTENSTHVPFDATNPMTSGNASGNTEHTNEAIDRTDASTLPGVRQSSPPPLEAISSSSRLSSSVPIAAESGHEDFIDGSV